MSTCATDYLPAGLNQDCQKALSEVKNVYFCDTSVSFSSPTNLYNQATWTNYIKQDLKIWIPQGKTSYEVTTDDPNIVTTAEGTKFISNNPPPSGMFYLDTNFCDYKQALDTLKGGTYHIIYELRDGSLLMRGKSDGTYEGFPARVHAINKGIPLQSDIANNFPVYINHTDYRHFKDAVLWSPSWDKSDLLLAMPEGLYMSVYTDFSSDVVVVRVTERCGDTHTGLTVSDFEVTDSNFLDTPAVTAVTDNSDGTYDVTLQKGSTPASLTAGDYITFRAKVTSGSDVTYVSNRLTVHA